MDLYNRYEALSPIYQGGLTNHLPMMLIALEDSHVEREEIIRICDAYRDEKALFDLTDNSLPKGDFEQTYINRTSYYLGELHHKGIDIVLGMFLNERTQAISSGLFHGLIRLSYAFKSQNDLQIAQALAYFELITRNVTLEGISISSTDFSKYIEEQRQNMKNLNYMFTNKNTTDKFNELLELDIVKNSLVVIDKFKINREDILDTILTRYLETNDFYILHLITGYCALHHLEEFFTDFNEVLQQFTKVAQVFMMFNTKKEVYKVGEVRSFSELLKEINTHHDAHNIKLLYSLSRLNKIYFNDKILLIASTIL